jgi:hypothetical protein
MSGSKRSTTTQQVFDPEALSGIIEGLQKFQPGQGAGFDLQVLGGVPESISQLQQGGLLSQEQAGIDQQLAAIEAGGLGAEQRIEQSVREQSEARGLGSSRGAIAQEAAGLANIPLVQAQQRADIFGRAGQLQRQGTLAGAQLGLQARGQDIQARGQGLQAQQLTQQDEMQRLQLQLQALLGAGGLAGRQLSSTTKKSGGGLGGLIGGIAGAALGGPAGASMGARFGRGL